MLPRTRLVAASMIVIDSRLLSPPALNRFEFPTRIVLPASTTAIGTGAQPTSISAILENLAVSNTRTLLSLRAVT